MGRRFHTASSVPCDFNEEAFLKAMEGCKAQGGLFRTEKGFMAGVIVPSAVDPDWKMAVELAWWSEDRKGMHLLRQFEKWAKESGASEVRMTTLASLPRASKIMERVGYRSAEISWTKVI